MDDIHPDTSTACSNVNDFSASRSPNTGTAFEGLRRVKDDIPKRLWAVAAIGFWERAAFWGTTGPWQNYMQQPPAQSQDETPGALGLGQAQATRIYCGFYIGYYVAPLFFAILADNHLGRYKTILLSLILYGIGCVVLTVSSIPSLAARGWDMPGFIVALVCIAMGGGGFQTNISAFLAEQYTETSSRIKTLDSGERVVTDVELTLEYNYQLYFWVGNVGSLSMFLTVALEKRVSFTSAYALTSCFIAIALLLLVLGRNWYVRPTLKANLILRVASILSCASRNGFRMARADPIYQLDERHKVVPWNSQLVAELTRALGACRVLLAFVIFYLCFDQQQNNLISQSSQMETYNTPNDMVQTMNQVGCILFVPLVQYVLYPFLHHRDIYLRPITRIAIGFVFICTAMLYTSLVQHAIYSARSCQSHQTTCSLGSNRVNVWIQAPTYLFIAAGESFAVVTAIEWAYTNAPNDMKAIVQAINLLIAGLGSAFAMSLTPLTRDPNMAVFYGCLAGAMAVTTIIFWCFFRNFEDERFVKNAMGKEGECDNEVLNLGPNSNVNTHEMNDVEFIDSFRVVNTSSLIPQIPSLSLLRDSRVGFEGMCDDLLATLPCRHLSCASPRASCLRHSTVY